MSRSTFSIFFSFGCASGVAVTSEYACCVGWGGSRSRRYDGERERREGRDGSGRWHSLTSLHLTALSIGTILLTLLISLTLTILV